MQYEPGVLEACLKLLQVSPQHISNKHKDYIQRGNPVYVSRVICAMVRNNTQKIDECAFSSLQFHSEERFINVSPPVQGEL